MIANITKTQLAACRYVLKGKQLSLARMRIRLSMGSLKALGEYWPLGTRTHQELAIIAREVLLLDEEPKEILLSLTSQPPIPEEVPLPQSLTPEDSFDLYGLYDLNFTTLQEYDTESSLNMAL
jgi:hypothetical protein